jgi:hypothetical protein
LFLFSAASKPALPATYLVMTRVISSRVKRRWNEEGHELPSASASWLGCVNCLFTFSS